MQIALLTEFDLIPTDPESLQSILTQYLGRRYLALDFRQTCQLLPISSRTESFASNNNRSSVWKSKSTCFPRRPGRGNKNWLRRRPVVPLRSAPLSDRPAPTLGTRPFWRDFQAAESRTWKRTRWTRKCFLKTKEIDYFLLRNEKKGKRKRTFEAKEVSVRLGALEFVGRNADRFGDGQSLHLFEVDVQVDEIAGSAARAAAGALELDGERDE